MLSLFRDFWWLVFPLGWFLIAAWRAWLDYKARRDVLDLIETYTKAGREPPPELFARLKAN